MLKLDAKGALHLGRTTDPLYGPDERSLPINNQLFI
jgi:hypothetical protein